MKKSRWKAPATAWYLCVCAKPLSRRRLGLKVREAGVGSEAGNLSVPARQGPEFSARPVQHPRLFQEVTNMCSNTVLTHTHTCDVGLSISNMVYPCVYIIALKKQDCNTCACVCTHTCTHTYLPQYDAAREIPEKSHTMLFEPLGSKTMKLKDDSF